ncbi:hypothetical protein U0070_003981 [Myodes glareolus]|uniref:Uncharacterized protein n=1 Tax=Myodes glareolus TaxID=447135 RepID=A0AAW0KAY5_MYOGA
MGHREDNSSACFPGVTPGWWLQCDKTGNKLASLVIIVIVVLVLVANVDDQHDKAHEDAEGADDQLVAAEGAHRVVVGDVDTVGTPGQAGRVVALTDARVQLAKGGQRRRAHPHHEVLVDEASVVGIGTELVNRPVPVGRRRRAAESQRQAAVHQGRVAELDVVVGPPGYGGAIERHLDREGVVEEAVGDGAAGRDGQAGGAELVGGALVGWVAQRADQAAELRVVAGHAVAPVVLVEVGQLVVEVDGAREELGQREVPGARAAGRRRAALALGGAQRTVAGAAVAGVVVLQLLDAVGGVEEAQAQADESQAGAEEERQRDAGREQRLPGRETLLREGRVVGLVRAPRRDAPGHGESSAGRPRRGLNPGACVSLLPPLRAHALPARRLLPGPASRPRRCARPALRAGEVDRQVPGVRPEASVQFRHHPGDLRRLRPCVAPFPGTQKTPTLNQFAVLQCEAVTDEAPIH